ncbi:MAG: methyl-accepting chemotaxis protein [Treponema sp.]|nr:methyl-accepting chemotaxis protein [Treponema sp.]
MEARHSIKHKFLVFSIILFVVILAGGSTAFIYSMRQIVRTSKGKEMQQFLEIERIKLESSVGSEIAIAMKMADSPLIQRYFANPGDPDLEEIAFEEIAGYRRAFKGNTVFWVNDIDHKFFSDDSYAFTLDINDPDNYWYLMTLNETEKYNFNINYNPDLKVTNLWINAPVYNPDGKPIGILGTGIDLSAFIDSIYKDYSGSASLYFFNDAGEITGAKDTELVAQKASISSLPDGVGQEVLKRANSHKSEDLGNFITSEGEVAVGTVPALGWYITAVQPLSIADYLDSTMTVIFIAMMAVIAVIFIIFFIFMTGLLKPLKLMVKTLEQISGDWDLTRRLEIRLKDETGTLAEYFNLTFERMRLLLHGIQDKALTLSDTSEELNRKMGDSSQALGMIDSNIKNMRGLVTAQEGEVNTAAVSLDRILTELENLNSHIVIQAESVAQSSSAIEQMMVNIHSVTETLVKNTGNINSLTESSQVGREDLQKVSGEIQEIAHESEGLLEINSVMQAIASQTNLLAMNAAIEAAHAGVSGKGFAVVADEIRKLAENSGKQSKTISTVLKKIKSSIDTITKSTGVVLERFGTIEKGVETVASQETHIRNAMEEQETGSRNILDAVGRLNAVTGEVKTASSDMATASKEVHRLSGNLKRISGEVTGGMDNMTKSAEMITGAVNRVQEISRENLENIGALSGDIAKFKVESTAASA